MQTISLAILLLVPAQSVQAIEQTEAVLYILKLQDKETGAFKVTPDGKPSLRACNGAVKGFKYLGYGKAIPNFDKMKTFVMSCYDPKTGAFAEPGGKPDVAISSIGVMVACELGIPKEKFAKSMEYLNTNAKNFEEYRIAAAAVEAWGVKKTFDVQHWIVFANRLLNAYPPVSPNPGIPRPKTGAGREAGSIVALALRLGGTLPENHRLIKQLPDSNWPDGGWGKEEAKTSDLESTYRVMRALMLMKVKPKDPAKLKEFLASCRNKDGGFGVTPGEKSSMSGTYYYAAISHWLEGMK